MSATRAMDGGHDGGGFSDPGTGEGDDYPPPGKRWWTVAVLTLLYSVSFMDRQVFALLIEPIRVAMKITDFQAGLLHGLAFSIFYVTFGMLFGWAVDRYYRRSIIFAGVAFWSIAASGCGAASSFAQLCAARFGVGAGEAALGPGANSILADSFPRHRMATAISIFGSGPAIGGGLAFILGGGLLAILPNEGIMLPILGLTEPWRVVFLATGAPGILIALLVWTFPEPLRRQRLGQDKATFGAAFRFMREQRRFFTAHLLGVGLLSAPAYGFSAWLPTWIMRAHGLNISEAGFLLAGLTVVPGVIGVVAMGVLTDHLFARGIRDAHFRILIGMAVAQTVLVTIAVVTSSLVIACIFTALYLLVTGYAGIAPAALQLVTPNEFRGKITAIYGFSVLLIGFGLGPPLVGALATYVLRNPSLIGWAMASVYFLLAPLAMLALWYGLRPMRLAVANAELWQAPRDMA